MSLTPEERAACDLVERMLRELGANSVTLYYNEPLVEMMLRMRSDRRYPPAASGSNLAAAIARARAARKEKP